MPETHSTTHQSGDTKLVPCLSHVRTRLGASTSLACSTGRTVQIPTFASITRVCEEREVALILFLSCFVKCLHEVEIYVFAAAFGQYLLAVLKDALKSLQLPLDSFALLSFPLFQPVLDIASYQLGNTSAFPLSYSRKFLVLLRLKQDLCPVQFSNHIIISLLLYTAQTTRLASITRAGKDRPVALILFLSGLINCLNYIEINRLSSVFPQHFFTKLADSLKRL